MDSGALGSFTAQVMEQISDRFDDDARIRTIAILVEVDKGDENEILVVSDDDRPWVQIAFLEQGVETLEMMLDEVYEAEDDD